MKWKLDTQYIEKFRDTIEIFFLLLKFVLSIKNFYNISICTINNLTFFLSLLGHFPIIINHWCYSIFSLKITDSIFDIVNQARSHKHRREITFDFRRRWHSGSGMFVLSNSFLSQLNSFFQSSFLIIYLHSLFQTIFNSHSYNRVSRIFIFRKNILSRIIYSQYYFPLAFFLRDQFDSHNRVSR